MDKLSAVELVTEQLDGLMVRVLLGATGTLGLLLVIGFVSLVAGMLLGEVRAGRTHRACRRGPQSSVATTAAPSGGRRRR